MKPAQHVPTCAVAALAHPLCSIVQEGLGTDMAKIYDPESVLTVFAPTEAAFAKHVAAAAGSAPAGDTAGAADDAAAARARAARVHVVAGVALNASAVAEHDTAELLALMQLGEGVRSRSAIDMCGVKLTS